MQGQTYFSLLLFIFLMFIIIFFFNVETHRSGLQEASQRFHEGTGFYRRHDDRQDQDQTYRFIRHPELQENGPLLFQILTRAAVSEWRRFLHIFLLLSKVSSFHLFPFITLRTHRRPLPWLFRPITRKAKLGSQKKKVTGKRKLSYKRACRYTRGSYMVSWMFA